MDVVVDPFTVIRRSGSSEKAQESSRRAFLVLEAVEGALHQVHGEGALTPSQYLSAFVSSLESDTTDDAESFLLLFATLMDSKQCCDEVLAKQFQVATEALFARLQLVSDSVSSMRSLMRCLGALLISVIQLQTHMNHPNATKTLQALLVYSLDPRSRVRKSARHALETAMHSIDPSRFPSKFGSVLTNFSMREITTCDLNALGETVYLLSLFRAISTSVPIPLNLSIFNQMLDQWTQIHATIRSSKSTESKLVMKAQFVFTGLVQFAERFVSHIADVKSIVSLIQSLTSLIQATGPEVMQSSCRIAAMTCLNECIDTLGAINTTAVVPLAESATRMLLDFAFDVQCSSYDHDYHKACFAAIRRCVVHSQPLIANTVAFCVSKLDLTWVRSESTSFMTWAIEQEPMEAFDAYNKTITTLLLVTNREESEDTLRVLGACMFSFSTASMLDLIHEQRDRLTPLCKSWLVELMRNNVSKHDSLATFFRLLDLAAVGLQELDQDTMWSALPSFCHHGATDETVNQLLDLVQVQSLSLLAIGYLGKGFFNIQQSGTLWSSLPRASERVAALLPHFIQAATGCGQEQQELLANVCRGIQVASLLTPSKQRSEAFQKLLKDLLRCSKEDTSKTLLEVVIGMVGSLEEDSVSWLYKTLQVEMQTEELQKKALKVLAALILTQNATLGRLNIHVLEDLQQIDALTGSGAKRAKLKVIQALVQKECLAEAEYGSVVCELILAIKESSERTREIGWELLHTIAETYLTRGDTDSLIGLLISGLAGSPHLQSGTILTLSAVVYEFYTSFTSEQLGQVLDTVLVLLSNVKAREVVQSCLGFIKVSITMMDTPMIQERLEPLMQGLVFWLKEARNRFRQRIRAILERLMKKLGHDTVKECMLRIDPATDTTFIDSIWKRQKRIQRKKAESWFDKKRRMRDMMDFEKGSSDEEMDTTNNHLETFQINEDEDEMDLLTRPGMASVKTKAKQRDANLKTDEHGRFIIDEDDSDSEPEVQTETKTTGRVSLKKHMKAKKRRRGIENEHDGSKFKAKKAGGDVHVAGAPEPFALVNLHPKFLNKRNRNKSVQQFEGIVNAANRGSKKGTKAHARAKRRKR